MRLRPLVAAVVAATALSLVGAFPGGSSAQTLDKTVPSAALRGPMHALPTFFGFYVGRGDRRFRAENVQLNRELDSAHVPHVFEVYAGRHTSSLWQRHAQGWLRMAVDRLAAAAGSSS